MVLLPLILYGIGITGIIVSLVLIFSSMKSKGKFSLTLIGITFLISVVLMVSGTAVDFLMSMFEQESQTTASNLSEEDTNNINSASATDTISSQASDVAEPDKPASVTDLSLTYKLVSSKGSANQNADIDIKNNSNEVFNGTVTLTFTDSSNSVTNTLTLPVQNLMPSTTYEPNAIVSDNAVNASYNFSGTFSTSKDTSISYTIKSITASDKFIRFDVSCDDTSYTNLTSISNDFASKYTSDICDGFLVYYYPSSSDKSTNFNNAKADYYCDNQSHTSNLTMHDK